MGDIKAIKEIIVMMGDGFARVVDGFEVLKGGAVMKRCWGKVGEVERCGLRHQPMVSADINGQAKMYQIVLNSTINIKDVK